MQFSGRPGGRLSRHSVPGAPGLVYGTNGEGGSWIRRVGMSAEWSLWCKCCPKCLLKGEAAVEATGRLSRERAQPGQHAHRSGCGLFCQQAGDKHFQLCRSSSCLLSFWKPSRQHFHGGRVPGRPCSPKQAFRGPCLEGITNKLVLTQGQLF